VRNNHRLIILFSNREEIINFFMFEELQTGKRETQPRGSQSRCTNLDEVVRQGPEEVIPAEIRRMRG
jgi:hypothetical protein